MDRPPASTPQADLTLFLLSGPELDLPAQAPAKAPTNFESISDAWNSFISPAPVVRTRCVSVPASAASDSALKIAFRFPEAAVAPPRLGAFAMPSWIDAEAADKPRDVSFALTSSDGGRLFGTVLQLCEPRKGFAAEQGAATSSTRCELSALVLLSSWPAYEIFKCLLHHVYSQREALWPVAPEPAERLSALLLEAQVALCGSRQELEWLTQHPLWLPTPLAPLFKALRWEPSEAAYLLLCLLTDQKVLLHSTDVSSLFCACEALKALITPLEYRAVYIPLLPASLMSLDEVGTLLTDCSTPYLIGCETALLSKLGSAAPATLLPLSVVVDLDAGTVHHPSATGWFKATAPPIISLCRELSRCMGDVMQFREAAAQAACLRFVVNTLNLGAGFLSRSPAPADAEAASRLQLLGRYGDDLRKRCAAAGMEERSVALLVQAMHQSEGALLESICADASDAARRQAERAAQQQQANGGWGGVIGDIGTTVDSGPIVPPDCCAQLRHVYASMSFREWWMEPARARSPEKLQWMQYRAKGIDLLEYVRENRSTLAMLERSVEERLHSVYASSTPAAPAAAAGTGLGKSAAPTAGAASSAAATAAAAGPYGSAVLPRPPVPDLPRARAAPAVSGAVAGLLSGAAAVSAPTEAEERDLAIAMAASMESLATDRQRRVAGSEESSRPSTVAAAASDAASVPAPDTPDAPAAAPDASEAPAAEETVAPPPSSEDPLGAVPSGSVVPAMQAAAKVLASTKPAASPSPSPSPSRAATSADVDMAEGADSVEPSPSPPSADKAFDSLPVDMDD